LINPAQYADFYQPDFGVPREFVKSREQLEKLSMPELLDYEKKFRQFEAVNRINPVQGWSLLDWHAVQKSWKNYKYLILLGGNRSGKSTFMARLAVWTSCTIPGAEVHMYQANSEKSVNEQQRYIWESIPPGIKNMPTKKGVNHSLTWSQKNGFTDDVCIFPPHSGAKQGGYIRFRNYAQYADDANTAESFKSHLTILDEECPIGLFDTMAYRTLDYRGRIVLGFTTIMGWTPLIQKLLGVTKTIKSRMAPLLNCELPIIQEAMFADPKNKTGAQACIFYFWTERNLFIDVQDFKKQMAGRPRDEILARAYGIPTKSASSVFPSFSRDVHVVEHSKLPWIKNPDYKITRYHVLDPAGRKHWFMIWAAIDVDETVWVYAEWPSFDSWALPGNKAGPAQAGSRMGIRDYVNTILEEEKGTTIFERLIDPRAGAAEKQAQDGATNIISDLDENNIVMTPAPGVDEENGLQGINNLLAWDEKKPRDSLNAPRLYISDRCANVIFALSEYTAKLGATEMTKDPIDCLRYLVTSGVTFCDESSNPPVVTSGY
jgi:hypothetical protein